MRRFSCRLAWMLGMLLVGLAAACSPQTDPASFQLIDAPAPAASPTPANYPDSTPLAVERQEPAPFPSLARATTPSAEDSVDTLIARGRLLLHHARPQQARAIFDLALERAPDSAAAYAGRALTYLVEDDIAATERELRMARNGTGVHPLVLIANARALAVQANYSAAHVLASFAVELTGGDVEAYWIRSEVLQGMGELEQAVRDLDRALEIDASFPPALLSYADLATRSGQDAEAMNVLGLLIERDPANPVYYYHRSRAHEATGRLSEAIADANRAIERDPGRAEYFRYRGQLHERNADLDAADADYRMAIRLDPDSPFGYLQLASLAADRGDFALAVPLAEEGLSRVRPNDPRDEALALWSTILARYGETQQALDGLTEAVRINPQNATVRLQRAAVAMALRDFDLARQDLDWVRANGTADEREAAEPLLEAITAVEQQQGQGRTSAGEGTGGTATIQP